MHKHFLFVAAPILALCLACNSDTESAASGNGGNTTTNSTDLSRQSQLPGRIMFNQGEQAWIMDFATGSYVTVNDTPWNFGTSSVGVDFAMSSPQTGDEFVVYSFSDCLGTFGSIEEYCLQVYSQDNEVRSTYIGPLLVGDMRSALLSPDQRFMLLVFSLNSKIYLVVDRQFNPFDAKGLNNIIDHDWLPDNRLILASDSEIHITNPLSLETQRSIRLQDLGLTGEICEVDSSPNGKSLLVGISNESRRCMPWIVNLDDNSIQQLATRPDPTSSSLFRYEWSPNGDWVYMQTGASAGTFLVNTNTRGYVLPSTLQNTPYIISSVTEERSSEVIPLFRKDIFGRPGDYSVGDNLVQRGFNFLPYWIE